MTADTEGADGADVFNNVNWKFKVKLLSRDKKIKIQASKVSETNGNKTAAGQQSEAAEKAKFCQKRKNFWKKIEIENDLAELFDFPKFLKKISKAIQEREKKENLS